MSDLIDRQAAIDAFPIDDLPWDTYCGYAAPHYVKEILEQLPSAQPAQPEPLTCHGCKHDNEWYEGCKTCIRLHSYKTDNYEEDRT